MAQLFMSFALKPPKIKHVSLRGAKIHLTSFQQEAICFHMIFYHQAQSFKLLAVVPVILLTLPKSWFMMRSSLKFYRAQRADF